MISYYIFDSIERDELGCYWGIKGDKISEVFQISEDETDEELITLGFAKCGAEGGTETFCVEERVWVSLIGNKEDL